MQAQSKRNERGIVTKASPHSSVSETIERLQETVRERSLDVFTLIDHSGAAEQVGLTMQESELLISNTDAPHQGEPKDDLWSAQKELHEEERPEC